MVLKVKGTEINKCLKNDRNKILSLKNKRERKKEVRRY